MTLLYLLYMIFIVYLTIILYTYGAVEKPVSFLYQVIRLASRGPCGERHAYPRQSVSMSHRALNCSDRGHCQGARHSKQKVDMSHVTVVTPGTLALKIEKQ